MLLHSSLYCFLFSIVLLHKFQTLRQVQTQISTYCYLYYLLGLIFPVLWSRKFSHGERRKTLYFPPCERSHHCTTCYSKLQTMNSSFVLFCIVYGRRVNLVPITPSWWETDISTLDFLKDHVIVLRRAFAYNIHKAVIFKINILLLLLFYIGKRSQRNKMWLRFRIRTNPSIPKLQLCELRKKY